MDAIGSGVFSDGDRGLFRPIVDSLLGADDYMLLADYQAYVDCQQRVADAYRDRAGWTRMPILNSARVGRFSSDHSICTIVATSGTSNPPLPRDSFDHT